VPIEYDPKDASNCWPEGDYDAVLKTVEDAVSKTSGQPMQVWTIECYNNDGRKQLVTEYVTAAAIFKLKQLAVALDRRADFEARNFQADDVIGSNFRVHLTVESQDGYDDKNRVGKFLPSQSPATQRPGPRPAGNVRDFRPARAPSSSPVSEDSQFKDDEIPFRWEGRAGPPV
jgi:hypothetical protein